MKAPLPVFEIGEFPYKFVARTYALILEPKTRLKGADVRVSSGIVHFLALKTTVFDPSQFKSSAMNDPVAVSNYTKKLVRGDPFAKGATHVTTTLLFSIVVTGASGRSGLKALKIATLFD